ncbi:trichohyalin-like [Papaver somniferum]|uniref:trichohyalin-like n=1 Tax=Papaver somniferum TaxID=3469 RepID=UPI000E6FF95D|nr:trichohyalin-like [Papaver somniferum]
MVRIGSVIEQTAARRSARIAKRRRGEIPDQPEMEEINIQRNEDTIGNQRIQEQNNPINYDRVSVHTSQIDSTEEEDQRTAGTGMIEGNEDNMTIAELRQRLITERSREDEIRANLIRKNDNLREESLRLQDQGSRSATNTRSRSRTSRSLSRQSQSNKGHARRERNLGENLQLDDNLQDQREARRMEQRLEYDRHEQPREHHRRREYQRIDRYQNAGEYHRIRHERDNNEEHDPEHKIIILHGREMLRDQYAREDEEERNNELHERERDERERRRRRREEIEEREIQEAMRQNNRENRLRQARLKRPMRYYLDQSMSEEILKEIAEL